MSTLNYKNTAVAVGLKKESFEGNIQDVKKEEQQLYEIAVMTMYGRDSFYESTSDVVKRLQTAISKIVSKGNFDYIANVIIHARTAMNIRTMPIMMTVLFAKALRDQNKSYPLLRQLVRDVIQRPDQLTDMYAAALDVFGQGIDPNQRKRHVPIAIKKGTADAFGKFNEYSFGKYNRPNAVKLRDVLRIVYPKPKDQEQYDVYNKIRNEQLETPYTWEVELSKNDKPKDQTWHELINSGKVGFMALLRNLRNILEAANVPNSAVTDADINLVCERLQNEKEVLNSKQLPFRFYNAFIIFNGDIVQYRYGNGSNQPLDVKASHKTKIISAISKALDISLRNVPTIGKGVWIITDCSGSMDTKPYNQKSKTYSQSYIETACLFMAALFKANALHADNIGLSMFSDNAKFITKLNPNDSVITMTKQLMGEVYGGGTNMMAAINQKPQLGFEPDTVIVLSDMQVNSLSYGNPSLPFNKECTKIAINLASYDSTPIGEQNGWFQLAGWSDKLFDFIPAFKEQSSIAKKLSVPYLGMEIKNLFKVEVKEEAE